MAYPKDIRLIAAVDLEGCIGKGGDMPWGLTMKSDLSRFKRLTTGATVIMGRKTFESIGTALPDRLNIVLSRDSHFKHDSLLWDELSMPEGQAFYTVAPTRVSALALADYINPGKPIYVIGGAQIFSEFMPYARQILLTEIQHRFVGDAYFPEIPRGFDKESSDIISPEVDTYSSRYITYTR